MYDGGGGRRDKYIYIECLFDDAIYLQKDPQPFSFLFVGNNLMNY